MGKRRDGPAKPRRESAPSLVVVMGLRGACFSFAVGWIGELQVSSATAWKRSAMRARIQGRHAAGLQGMDMQYWGLSSWGAELGYARVFLEVCFFSLGFAFLSESRGDLLQYRWR